MSDMHFTLADERKLKQIIEKWAWIRREWLHIEGGFTFIALDSIKVVGFISVRWRNLPGSLNEMEEGFIDIIEVDPKYRRQGIATRLVRMSEQQCIANGACQIRAWSSEDKVEAIHLWHSLRYCLCPAADYPRGKPIHGYFVAKSLSTE